MDNKLNLPADFETYPQARKAGFMRMKELKDNGTKMVEEYNIDGVIEIVLQSCHTYDVEAYYVKKLVTEKLDKAYLNIETDYSQSDKGQINTRLAAFLETIDR